MEQLSWVLKVKLKIFISLSRFTLLNKHEKLTDHETENLVFDRNYGKRGCKLCSPVNLGIFKAQHQTNYNRIVFKAI